MNLLLLRLLVDSARDQVAGAMLGTPTWYRPVLVVPFTPARAPHSIHHLVAVLEAPGPFVFVCHERPFEGARAPEKFTSIAGRRVADVSQVAHDRVIRVETEGGVFDASEPTSLEIHLYGSRGSALVRRGESALESVGARRPDEWRPGERRTLLDIDARALETAVSLTLAEGAHTPQALVPGVDPALVAAFTPSHGAFDAAGLIAFRDALLAGDRPFLLVAPGRIGDAAPVPVEARVGDRAFGPFGSGLDACATIGEIILSETKKGIVSALAKPLRRRLAAQLRLLENLDADLEHARGHEQVRREAETLAAYQSAIRPGADVAEFPDPYDAETTVRIALDPALPIQRQIDKRFKKASKLQKSEEHTRRRIDMVRREVLELEAALRLLDSNESLAKSLLQLDALRDRFDIEAGDRRPGKERPGTFSRGKSVGRRYDFGDGWYALVGRDNKDNDDLTFHHSAPTDLWFHAQGVPGSHVILKTSRPSGAAPARVIELAASVAAHFSKARHSRLVPVIYTQRKYVRKFRGAKPGQVVCEREKMVMVEPRVPGPVV